MSKFYDNYQKRMSFDPSSEEAIEAIRNVMGCSREEAERRHRNLLKHRERVK